MATLLLTGISNSTFYAKSYVDDLTCFLLRTLVHRVPSLSLGVIWCGELTRVQALHDGGGVDQVAGAQWTCEVRIEICDFNPVGLHFIHVGRSAEEAHQH